MLHGESNEPGAYLERGEISARECFSKNSKQLQAVNYFH